MFFVFRDSYVLCIYVLNILCTRWEGGRWKSQNRKNVYLSPYVEEASNSKVIKSFVPELRSRKCFSCFEIPMFYVYMFWTFYVRDGRGGRWRSQNRKNVYLSPCVEEPSNSKVIKSFVPELRNRYVFFVFRDSYVLCIYVTNILCTFHTYPDIWLCYISAN